jgi:hypothetical protein
MADAAEPLVWWARHAKSVVSSSFAIPPSEDHRPTASAESGSGSRDRTRQAAAAKARNRRAARDGGAQTDQVRAGRSRPVPLSLTLDPRTPPGAAQAELDVNGEQRSVVVHITEDVALALSPDEIVLPGAPVTFEKRVVFTNEGNVPVHVKALGAVVLEDDAAHCRACAARCRTSATR